MNQMLEAVLLVFVVILSIGVVFNFGSPLIQSARTGSFIEEAKTIMLNLDHLVKEVAEEGKGSTRTFSFQSHLAGFEIIPKENVISFNKEVSFSMFQYGSKKKEDTLISYNGGGVDCRYNENKIIIENELLKIVLNKFNGMYNTENIISYVESKINGKVWNGLKTPIMVNDDNKTQIGYGSSIILNTGYNLPRCTVKYTMNSTVNYNMFFSLTTGSDFVSLKIRDLK